MIYLFYTNIKDCQDQINECDAHLILEPGMTYARPEKHPTKNIWALCIEEHYRKLFTSEKLAHATPKDESWNPPLLMNE